MDIEIDNIQEKNNNKNFSEELKKSIEKNEIIFSIDRFEGEFAVCENCNTNEMVNIPKKLLPDNCMEGSIIKFENGRYILDSQTTNTEQENIKNLVDNLFKRK